MTDKNFTLINVSNRLPIKIENGIKANAGGLVSAFHDIKAKMDFSWFGWSGTFEKTKSQKTKIINALKPYQYHPIFINQNDIACYYDGFCNSSLWPLLHYFPSHYKYQYEWYLSYLKVNETFAECLIEKAPQNSFIWIHDYHLFLLPLMLKQSRPDLTIGFFLHTPFPSYEIFRIHPKRRDLLKGLMGSDLIGFHTYSYLRHFKSAILRILEFECTAFKIKHQSHTTELGVFPIGISYQHFKQICMSKDCQNRLKKLTKTTYKKKVLLSVERLDYTKGILEKLQAIDVFLDQNPNWLGQVSFIQVAVPSRLNNTSNQELVKEIEINVSKINGKYATLDFTPIHFIYHAISNEDLCALYQRADVALVTPLIDGMNLVAKEYIACKQENPAVLILSEFAGAAQELQDALSINPHDAWKFAKAIKVALEMSHEEALKRNKNMLNIVKKNDSRFWATRFLMQLTSQSKHTVRRQNVFQNNRDDILKEIQTAKTPFFFFDYDGTLREIEKMAHLASPTEEIFKLLNMLISNYTHICIISGRPKDDLENWFAKLRVHLVAEHGYFIKQVNQDWCSLIEDSAFSWKSSFIPIMSDFSLSTPGSYLEEKHSSLVWHYRRCDPDFGHWKAQQLFSELHSMTHYLPVKIQKGFKKTVEVSSSQVNKGLAVKKLIEDKGIDKVFCFGDDITDESMFELNLKGLISVKIGSNQSLARYRLSTPQELRSLFLNMIPQS